MNKPAFVISLDFELFWGVTQSSTIASYGRHVEGEWQVIPKILSLFRRHNVHATWATVGMAMCRDYQQWNDIRPALMPGYLDERASTYNFGHLARAYPDLFFARPLVQQILDTPGQELASHTYSHFFCGEEGATPEQFAADLACLNLIAQEIGATLRSVVMPRNQVRDAFLEMLPPAGITSFRGNPDHWLYRNGHVVPGGIAGRVMRLADAWLPLAPIKSKAERMHNGLVNVPASLFLRPWNARLAQVEPVRMHRLCQSMTAAARSKGIFHLWWHPHNFGTNQEENLAVLDAVLSHYAKLRDAYGMCSMTMNEFANSQEIYCQAAA
jgi:peptidoglycan/xylan/chitin deacetylase (PgdA/CDA1 family)